MPKFTDLKYLFTLAWKMTKSLCLVTAANNIFNAFLPLINIVGLSMVVDALVTDASYESAIKLIAIYLSVNLSAVIIGEIFTMLNNIVMRKVTNIMQYQYSADSVNVDYHYAQDRTILGLRRKSMMAHPGWFLGYIGKFLKYIIQFAGIAYIFSRLSPMFILIIASTSAVSIVLTFRTRQNDFDFQNNKVEDDRKLDYLYNVMTRYKYAKEIRINNAEAYIGNKYEKILKTQINKLKALYQKTMHINLLSAVMTIIQTAAMYFNFSYQLYDNRITIAEYTMLLGSATLLTSLLLGFFDNIAQVDKACKSAEFYREYLELIEKRSSIIASNTLPERAIDFRNAVIEFENVSFSYPETENIVLRNINIQLKKGEKIGVVGLNGSGKTTFVKLLSRIYDPSEGRITINGVDIREIPYRQYIKHIGIVLQDFLLFAYSIRENIMLDTAYNESKFNASIEKSGLKGKIDSLKNGTETSVYKTLDENGVEFSGGEGQKLALARAIYKDAELLILDEPTSALDPIAEYELFSKLNDIAENKAAIFISHRLSSTKFCDRIIALSEGKIIECGSHNELIKQNGFYADLFNAQAKYYKEKGAAVYE